MRSSIVLPATDSPPQAATSRRPPHTELADSDSRSSARIDDRWTMAIRPRAERNTIRPSNSGPSTRTNAPGIKVSSPTRAPTLVMRNSCVYISEDA